MEVVTEAKGHILRDMNPGCIHIDDSSGIHVEKEVCFVPKPHSLYISFFRIEASFFYFCCVVGLPPSSLDASAVSDEIFICPTPSPLPRVSSSSSISLSDSFLLRFAWCPRP